MTALPGKYGALLWMLSMQRRDRHSLRAAQQKLFRQLLESAAAQVPFYRKLYRADTLRRLTAYGLDAVEELPIVDKAMLRATAPDDRIDQRYRQDESLIEISTSGSTGAPFGFSIDHAYDQYRKAQYIRAHLVAGRNLRDRVFRLSDVSPDIRGQARPAATGWFRRLRLLSEYHLFPDARIDRQIAELNRLKPDVVHGYGSSLSLMAAWARNHDISLHSPRLIITDSELLLTDRRALIEQAFGAPVRDIYGTFETDNIGFQCPAGDGYHVALESVHLEIVRDGQPVADGEPGEVVCTVLHNRVSPLLRYNLGDIAALSPEPCGCGSALPTLHMSGGRADDFATGPRGQPVSPRTFLSRFDSLSKAILEYQITQVQPDRFIVNVVPGRSFCEASRDRITSNLHEVFPDAQVEIRTLEKIDRGRSGKLRVFVSALT